MSESQSSLLTERQRKYLRGDVDPSNESRMKKRIRERVYKGLRWDGGVLLDNLPADERRRLFRMWENQRHDNVREDVAIDTNHPIAVPEIHKTDFEIGLRHLLGFVYLGVEETNLKDFETLLEQGINRAVQERGQRVKELNLEIKFGSYATVEDLQEMLENGKIEVSDIPISRRADMIDSDSIELSRKHEEEMRKSIKSIQETLTSVIERMDEK